MPSLLAGQDMFWATGSLFDHFLTFSQQIIINKEPKKTISNVSTPSLAGYSNRRQEISYELTPQSGIMNAIVTYPSSQNAVDENNLQIRIKEGEVSIKTTGNAKDYILDGKTENILIDDKVYNLTSSYKVQQFLGLKFYYFKLTETN